MGAPLITYSIVLRSIGSMSGEVARVGIAQHGIGLYARDRFTILGFTIFRSFGRVGTFFCEAIAVQALYEDLYITSMFSRLVKDGLTGVYGSLFSGLGNGFVRLVGVL